MTMTVDVAAKAISIMPHERLPLAGYSDRPDPFEGIASDLEASIVVIAGPDRPVVLVGLDTLFASAALEDHILRNLDQGAIDLFLIATHTHFAPGLDDRKPLLGSVAAAYLDQVGQHVADAIRELAVAVRPASARYGHGRASGGIYRRRFQPTMRRRFPFVQLSSTMAPNSRAETYDALQVAILGTPTTPRAVIWTWPCHAVASPDHLTVSADFPGEVRRAVRQSLGDATLPVIYLPGFCGDIRPDIRGSRWSLSNLLQNLLVPIAPFGRTTPETYRRFCTELSKRVVDTIEHSVPIDLRRPAVRQTRFAIGDYMAPTQDASIEIRSLAMGALSFLLVGAEVCSPYYRLLDHAPNGAQFFSGCAGPVFGYLPTNRQLAKGGYEVSGFLNAFGWKGRFSRKFEQDFIATVAGVATHALADAPLPVRRSDDATYPAMK